MKIEGLIGKKLGMMQYFDETGMVHPVTVIEAGPCYVVQMKSAEKDGCDAVQLAYAPQKLQRINKPMAGHFKKAGVGAYKYIKQFKISDPANFNLGQEISAHMFKAGEFVHITGNSKGKGFQGVMKRHNFKGGKDAHGSTVHRSPGSIGSSAFPSRVIKNKKMPGRMGNAQITIKNLRILDIRPDQNLILIKGSIPGHKNSLVYIKKQFF